MARYCEKCDNILDISKNILRTNTLNDLTPDTVSEDESDKSDQNNESDTEHKQVVDYEDILKKIEENKEVSEDALKNIDIRDLVKSEYYKKMNKKGIIKKKIIGMIEDMENSDGNIHAYSICNNCHYNKQLDLGSLIFSKNPEGVASTYDNTNDSFYRAKTDTRTVCFTRYFKCPNDSCPSRKGSVSTEAAIIRKENSYNIIHACTRCKTIKY